MAARGNTIIITTQPRGRFMDVVISGTPKPGVCMEILAGFFAHGNHQVRAYQPGTDGERRPVMVLLNKELIGGNIDDAYADGEMGRVYFPVQGEEMNVRVKNLTGTGTNDELADAEMMVIDSGTGMLIKSVSTPESEPFQSLDALLDVAADVLAPFIFTGY